MELQRFPRLHAQLIAVVSKLLRERLDPSSEYVQSVISIQAAYINTNHPSFVQDSANIARQTREGHSQKHQLLFQQQSQQSTHVEPALDKDSEAGGAGGSNRARASMPFTSASSSSGWAYNSQQQQQQNPSTLIFPSSDSSLSTSIKIDGQAGTAPLHIPATSSDPDDRLRKILYCSTTATTGSDDDSEMDAWLIDDHEEVDDAESTSGESVAAVFGGGGSGGDDQQDDYDDNSSGQQYS
ncbi:unnamed protein product [Tilletia controversa]|uniref:Dynamin stalk domain-containing protein n=1 Tax=Tilletia controversa TaxID=13291 RepID=A0A8X7MZ53_9BASI|nr:hypothetical protein CF328_g640 [Tilletia controversa]KAE8255141.1 hypothetical protein A4X06_0g579 [Tilletia controversa]CAD6911616.1 unnamed protein product [Tilletia controversa]CAD6922696.1 unnamed protein product [Tilletia controversa]